MKVALISPYSSITSPGVRLLSACLKEAGHEVKFVFMPAYPKAYARIRFGDMPYSDQALESLAELCSDCGLIGISLMTNFFQAAVQMTESLRERVRAPVIWGGIHPTVCPEQCLQYADLICVGEGDEAFPELVEQLEDGGTADGIRNIWSQKNGEIRRTETRPWQQNLGDLPIPDCDISSHYSLTVDRSQVVLMDSELKEFHLKSDAAWPGAIWYQTMSTRGCPRNCTYCANNALRTVGGAKGYCRIIPTDWVMRDLHAAIENYQPQFIGFNDDCLTCRELPELEALSRRYREEIRLPFRAMAIPSSISKEKMDCLVSAGLVELQIGVQSGSSRVLKIYRRQWAQAEVVFAAAKVLNQYADSLMPMYDFMLDNPYENREDVLRSAWMIRDLPRPAQFQLFSLRLYPGTELAAKTRADGLSSEETLEHFFVQRPSYCNLLCSAAVRQPPRWLFRLLTSRPALFLFDRRCLEPIYRLLYKVKRTLTKARNRRVTQSKEARP